MMEMESVYAADREIVSLHSKDTEDTDVQEVSRVTVVSLVLCALTSGDLLTFEDKQRFPE